MVMIRQLMELGVMVEPEAVVLLEGGNAERITEKLLKLQPMPFTIDAALARRLLTEEARPKPLRKVTVMKEMSVSDFAAAYGERYSALQRLLLKNPLLGSAVSVASASGGCRIIGMVKNGGRTIEDPSGEGALSTDVKLLDGDVVGAIGAAENGVFKASEIIFPGIQLKERSNALGTFTAGHGADCLIRTDATVFYDVNGTVAVASDADLAWVAKLLDVSEKEAAQELLKRRRLAAAPRDYLEPQPDFLLFNAKENFTEVFKGVTVVGVKEGNRAEIDLNTREATFK
jgi:hypothetical protein